MIQLLPVGRRIVVDPNTEDEQVRSSGLVVPASAYDSNCMRGVVVHGCAAGVEIDGNEPVPGDIVYYSGGYRVRDHIVVPLDNVIAIDRLEGEK